MFALYNLLFKAYILTIKVNLVSLAYPICSSSAESKFCCLSLFLGVLYSRSKIRDTAEKQFNKIASGDTKPNSWTLLDFGKSVALIYAIWGVLTSGMCWGYILTNQIELALVNSELLAKPFYLCSWYMSLFCNALESRHWLTRTLLSGLFFIIYWFFSLLATGILLSLFLSFREMVLFLLTDLLTTHAGDVVVHIFLPQQRAYYNLEEFYGNATPIELPFDNQSPFRS